MKKADVKSSEETIPHLRHVKNKLELWLWEMLPSSGVKLVMSRDRRPTDWGELLQRAHVELKVESLAEPEPKRRRPLVSNRVL